MKQAVEAALAGFERDGCPGVPTRVVNNERFWGKNGVEWLAAALGASASTACLT
jgi:2-hydroxychromene-2-carboxylate isomerase